jgi:hypothetical protein
MVSDKNTETLNFIHEGKTVLPAISIANKVRDFSNTYITPCFILINPTAPLIPPMTLFMDCYSEVNRRQGKTKELGMELRKKKEHWLKL